MQILWSPFSRVDLSKIDGKPATQGLHPALFETGGECFPLFYEKWVHPFEFCGRRVPGGDFSKMNEKTTSRLLQLSGSIQIFEFLGAEMTTLSRLVKERFSFTILNNEKYKILRWGS